MRKVSAEELKPGMIVAEPVYTFDHKQILIPAGTELSDNIIARIGTWQIPFLQIKTEQPDDNLPEANEPENFEASILPQEMIDKTRNFVNFLEGTVFKINGLLEEIRSSGKVDSQAFKEVARAAEPHLVQPSEAINRMLFRLPTCVDRNYLAYHSVAVASISAMLAGWMEYAPAAVSEIFLAGLLHDIGFSQVPRSLIADERPNEQRQQMIKEHVVHGLKLLKSVHNTKQEILAAVAQHHEMLDGSGYPLSLKGEKIHPYAKLIAFADTLCRMNESHAGTNPFELMDNIKAQMFAKLEPAICDTFIRRFNDYLLNRPVVLSDGRKAEVVYLAVGSNTSPVLKTEDDEFIDLTKKNDIKIEKVIF